MILLVLLRLLNRVRSLTRGNHDVCSAVSAKFCCGIESDGTKFLRVVRSEALDIPLRIRNSGFIGIDSIDGYIVRAISRAKDVCA